MQMYKVFVNDCPIILTDQKNISTIFEVIDFEEFKLNEIVKSILNNQLYGICLVCENLEICWQKFQSNFKLEEAAGGKVINTKKEVLFIYRFEKWDLPKGKIEKNESVKQCAIREVEEECGIKNLVITNPLPTTYHIFERKGKLIFKKTFWFEMVTDYCSELKPQVEEGITKVVFKNEKAAEAALENTYANIKLLF